MEININVNVNSDLKKYKLDIVLIAILLIGTFLRIYNLGFQSIWVDELHTMIESDPALTWREFDDLIMFREGIPHLHFILVRFMSALFGYNIITARIVSVVFGILSIYYTYKLGEVLFNKRLGYISSLLLSVSLFHIEYSQEARTYSMLLFFALVAFYRLALFIKDVNLTNAIYLGVFVGLITNAHPIGLLNVASVYLVILFYLWLRKNDRKTLFKYSLISGVIALIIFYPALRILVKVSKFTSFWIPEPTPGYLKQVFIDLFGGSAILAIAFLLFFTLYIIVVSKSLITSIKNKTLEENKYLLGFVILNIWLFFEIIVILVKSYVGISIVLHRYFIAIIPAMILLISFGIELIQNLQIKKAVIIAVTLISLGHIFLIENYYTTPVKSQFDLVADHVIKKNTEKSKVVSSWGWLMGYYYNESKGLITEERHLNDYLQDVRAGIIYPVSFWYVDGNSRPMALTLENQKFVAENFTMQNKFESHDAWGIEFKSKHKLDNIIDLRKFKPSMFDGSGAMIFIKNQTTVHPPLEVEKGNYALTFKGVSLPEKPIKGENAHINVFINERKIGDFHFSNKPDQKPIELNYAHPGGPLKIKLVYDNDIVVGNEDRNAVLNSITLKKMN